MKLSLIGGGGVRTVFFSQSLAKYAGKLGIDSFVIMDIDAEKLGIYGAMAANILKDTPNLAVTLTTDIKDAAKGTDYVVTTMRVGGDAGRIQDERIALKHGLLGQETTGAGGFSFALRSIPVMRDYCEVFQKYGNDPLIFNFTNPAGLVTQAMHDYGYHNVIGICDGPTELKTDISENTGIRMNHLFTRVYGLNHLSWLNSVQVNGVEILGKLMASNGFLENSKAFGHFDKELIRYIGAIPNEYLYYYYYREEAISNIFGAKNTRGEVIKQINDRMDQTLRQINPEKNPEKALEAYYAFLRERESSYMSIELQSRRKRNAHTDLSFLEDIPLPAEQPGEEIKFEGYSGVMFNYIDAVQRDLNVDIPVSVPSAGAINGLRDTDVAEVTCIVDRDGAHPVLAGDIPEQNLLLMQQVKLFERLVVEAVKRQSKELCIEALLVHPLIGSYSLAKKLAHEYLETFKSYIGDYK